MGDLEGLITCIGYVLGSICVVVAAGMYITEEK